MTFSWFLVYLGGTRVPETHAVCHPCDVMVGVSALRLTEWTDSLNMLINCVSSCPDEVSTAVFVKGEFGNDDKVPCE